MQSAVAQHITSHGWAKEVGRPESPSLRHTHVKIETQFLIFMTNAEVKTAQQINTNKLNELFETEKSKFD